MVVKKPDHRGDDRLFHGHRQYTVVCIASEDTFSEFFLQQNHNLLSFHLYYSTIPFIFNSSIFLYSILQSSYIQFFNLQPFISFSILSHSIPYFLSKALYSGESLRRNPSVSTRYWIFMTPSSICSGRGGQPGTYTSTGIMRSIPWSTLYVSKIPP